MRQNIITCSPDDDLYEMWRRMAMRNLQSMPVLTANGKTLGVLDIRDALKTLFEQEAYEEQLMLNYVAGIGYQ
jgi:predicted transcriptional regulator